MTALPRDLFRRYDNTPDEQFYTQPRLVTHIDAGATAAVTGLYRELFPSGGAILDLMSSWVSHLPSDVAYGWVVGLGMNAEELDANPRLDEHVVQNLNREVQLPFQDGAFDAAGCCVSVQYLTDPVAVFREVGRVLKPGAPFVVTFSNRCFPTKAVAVWQSLDDEGHKHLIKQYFEAAGNWDTIETRDHHDGRRRGDPLYAVVGRSVGSGQ